MALAEVARARNLDKHGIGHDQLDGRGAALQLAREHGQVAMRVTLHWR